MLLVCVVPYSDIGYFLAFVLQHKHCLFQGFKHVCFQMPKIPLTLLAIRPSQTDKNEIVSSHGSPPVWLLPKDQIFSCFLYHTSQFLEINLCPSICFCVSPFLSVFFSLNRSLYSADTLALEHTDSSMESHPKLFANKPSHLQFCSYRQKSQIIEA